MPSMGSNIKDKWFHGNAPRSQVEDLVKKAGTNGSFAVRTSESVPGGYTISLLFSGRVYTYRIIPTEGKYAIETNYGVQKKKFVSVDEMITEYRKTSNGLACGLTNPVGKSLSLFQRIKPDLPSRRSAPSRTQSALTMPLPPIPNTAPYVPVATAPPPDPFLSSPQPATAPPIPRANSFDTSASFGFNPAGILAAISGTNPTSPPNRILASDGITENTASAPSSQEYEDVKTTISEPAPPLPVRSEVPSEDSQQQAAVPPPPRINPEPESAENSKACVVCLDADINAFFQSCGHVCCCMDCAKLVKQCPLCRKKISKYHKAYVR